MRTLIDLLESARIRYGPSPFLGLRREQETSWWSYQRTADLSGQAAHWLLASGIRPGDRVGLWAPSQPRRVAAFFGLLQAGVVVVPLDVNSTPEFIQEVLARAVAVLQQGGAVGIFPEGRIGPEEGKLLPFRNGVGYLAIHGGAPIVPVALSGTSKLYLGRRITVTIGEVVPLADESLAAKQRAEATVQRVRHPLEAMLAPYEEPPGVVKRWRWLTPLM